MPALGVYLIYAAVLVRGLVRLGDMQRPGLVVGLLVAYGVLLIAGTQHLRRAPAAPQTGGPAAPPKGRASSWTAAAYLLVQAGWVVGLLLCREVQDSYALLFIPLSLQAVLLLGTRLGFGCIAAYTLAMAYPLIASQEGWTFGLVMVVNYGGICLLIGGYAHQSRAAEAARRKNERMLEELEAAHRQLQGNAAQREALAIEKERNRLARELHDSVTQTVFSMSLAVQSARLLMGADRARVAGQMERLEELAAGAMHEIQVLVSQLRPMAPGLPAGGLAAALRRLAEERRAHDGLAVALEVEGDQPLPEAVAAALYGIAQEALSNVARHAGARQATLRLHLAEGASTLEVEDAGLGFDPGAAVGLRGHLGLAGMAERAREIGWLLTVESQPGRGTRVRAAERAPEGIV